MDGNARWAKQRGLPKAAGHKQGAEALRRLLDDSRMLGIRYMTVYAFSSENWQRPAEEVDALMGLLRYYLKQELKTLMKNGIRLRVIGDRERLPEDVLGSIAEAEEKTRDFDGFHLNICLSYGARQEIAAAARAVAAATAAGEIAPAEISEEILAKHLYTVGLPDPDLLIRTGGEHRLSNFLLWQAAYAELYFTDTLWPDFSHAHLEAACAEYATRERRYGKRENVA